MAEMASNASLICEGGGQSATSNGDNEIDPHLDGVWTCFDFNDAKWTNQLRNFLSNSSSQDADILICIEGVTIDSIDLVDDEIDKLNIRGRRLFGALEEYLRSQRTARTTYADGGLKEPDDSFLPYHAVIATCLEERRDCPQIVFEVALSETLQRLNADIRRRLVKTRLQTRTAVGVKVDWLHAWMSNGDNQSRHPADGLDWFLGFSAATNETGLRTFWENNGPPMQDAEGEDDGGNQRATLSTPTELRKLHRTFRSLPAPKRRRAIRGTRVRRSWLINAFTELAEFQNANGAAPTNLGRHISNAAVNDQPQTPETLPNYEELAEAECERLLRLAEPDTVEINFRSGMADYVGGVRNILLRTSSLIGFEGGRNPGSSIALDEPFWESLFKQGVSGDNVMGRIRPSHLSAIGIAYFAYKSGVGQRVDTIPFNQAIDLVAQAKNIEPGRLRLSDVPRHFIQPRFQRRYV
ncbi:hypothetical protein TRICI_001847 [Trichomonascus ciferrii]|uniref:Uncharacterized protein n=1 Tax=Trichomonascus ciferrii TaxID=44093 RepID=A0A642V7G7_9ASCO|nr:hypothetical protein TRICI_001847 [Trichomonascus ciferrii]